MSGMKQLYERKQEQVCRDLETEALWKENEALKMELESTKLAYSIVLKKYVALVSAF